MALKSSRMNFAMGLTDMFKEEIDLMKLLSNQYSEDIQIYFGTPKSMDDIKEFEKEIGFRLPLELEELYQLTNGFDGFMTYMNLWSLETIKEHYDKGYNDWFEEGDGNQYIVLGSDGAGGYLLMEIATGHYLKYGDEGEVTHISSIKDLMCWNIDCLYDNVRGFEENERINHYLERNADRIE